MSAATLEQRARAVRSTGTTRIRQLRPGWGGGRGTRPISRSISGVGAPTVGSSFAARPMVRGCRSEVGRVQFGTVGSTAGWRLTDLSIAIILIAGAMIMVAAITVITATALTVTSGDYHPQHSAYVQR